MNKVTLGVAAALLATVVGAKLAYEATVYSSGVPGNQPWAQNTMEFVAWNGEKWTAWIRDGAFEQRPQNEPRWSPHTNVSVAFVAWDGGPWQAKVDGDAFLLAGRGDWNGSTERVAAIRYRDWNGKNQLRTLTQLVR